MGSATQPTRPSEPADGTVYRLERCTVGRWRGYRTYTFFAELQGGGVIAESGAFREGRGATEPSQGARERHRELVAALEASGWERAGESGDAPWYGTVLVRRVEAPAPEPEPPAAISPPPRETPAPRLDPVKPVARLAAAAAPPPAPAGTEAADPEAAAPPPPPPPARRSARTKAAAAALGLAAIVGIAGVAILDAGSPRAHASAPPRAPGRHTAAKAPAKPAVVPKKTAPTAAARKPVRAVHVTIAAPARASWLEIRRASAHGRVLFSGQLDAGKRLVFTGTRLWARFGAAGNLSIAVDGKPLVLMGTYEHVFTATPAR